VGAKIGGRKRHVLQLGHSAHPAIRSDYLRLSIIPTASKPKRSATPLMTVGALIAVGAALIFVLGR
jgi:hypothetical protein